MEKENYYILLLLFPYILQAVHNKTIYRTNFSFVISFLSLGGTLDKNKNRLRMQSV